MMTRAARTLAIVAALATAASTAAAQDVLPSSTIQATFRGVAPAGCRLDAPTAPSTSNATVGGLAPGSAEIAFNPLVGDDSAPLGASVRLVLPAICNQAHTLSLTSVNGGLKNAAGPPPSGPFRAVLPYNVVVTWAGEDQSFASGQGATLMNIGDAVSDVVTVTIQLPAGGAPLTAGTYSDELVLELGVAG
ncbi:MAG: hypothetical protein IT546_07995 [Caulobacteraceae bacterium]|nr:hypothetical protein [Caulobacteraceae bacterium]